MSTKSGVNNAVANWVAGSNSATYTVQWQAPATDVGTLTFWAAGNAINNNFSSSGDTIYLTNVAATFSSGTGACCDDSTGVCQEGLTQANCEGGGGRFGGSGSTCGTINPPCLTPTGACCNDGNGVCTEVQTQSACETGGGRYGGNDSTCATISPPCVVPPTGACCDDRGVCTEDVLQIDCENNGSRFGGENSTCATIDPPCETPLSISLETYVSGLISPIDMANPADGSGRNFIVEQTGQIRVALANGTLLPTPFLDIASNLVSINAFYDERGLLGMAFHPDYATNGRFFIRYSLPRAGLPEEPCNDPLGFIVGCHEEILAEYHVLGDPATSNVADPSSEIILFRADKPQFNHNGGQVAFGPDGYLYFTLGDGGGANDGLADGDPPGTAPTHGPIGNGQNRFAKLGKVHRLDVDSPPDPGLPYAVPPTNPFADGVDGLPEIFAYGLRNPYKFSFDDGPGGLGLFWLPDVGQDRFEEINIGFAGANYGWVIREAGHCFDPLNPTTPPASCPTTGDLGEPLINPIMEYAHPVPCTTDGDCAPLGLTCDQSTGLCENEGGISIIGGYLYRGSGVPSLTGKYAFGDFSSAFFTPDGRLYYINTTGPDPSKRRQFYLSPNNAPLGQFLKGYGRDEAGELYVLVSTVLGPQGTGGSVLRIAAPFPSAPAADPTGINKCRFISFSVPPTLVEGSVETALRVNLTTLHNVVPPYTGGPSIPFTAFEGQSVWVGPPATYVESTSSGIPFQASFTQCTPDYRDWSTVGLLHVTGSAIVPSSIYQVESVAAICQTPFWENTPACMSGGGYVSSPLEIRTTRWADLETPYNPPSTTTQPDVGDVAALVNKFRDAPGAPIKARAMINGSDAFGNITTLGVGLGFSQISACVNAFRGQAYPFTMGSCNLGGQCGHDGVFCNSTSDCVAAGNTDPCIHDSSSKCNSDADCVGNYAPPCNLYCP